MIPGGILNSRAGRARRSALAAARVTVAVLAVLAVLGVSAAAAPALAAPRPGGPAASHTRAAATGQHAATGRMSSGAPWTQIAAGCFHTCGIRTGGTLWCWGQNYFGQLGIGNYTSHNRPQQVTTPAPGGWAGVTAGGDQTCATRTGGTLWCWGSNLDGELGIGSYTDQDRPQQVTTPAPGAWAGVIVSVNLTCATRTGGTLWCWGELGPDQDLPQQVTTPAAGGWADITVGDNHVCATRSGGTLWCWGDNFNGQLGIGSHSDQDRPRQVTSCALPAAQPPSRSGQ